MAGGLTLKDKLMMHLAHMYKQARPGLSHYPVITIGANAGGLFTKHFVHHSHGISPFYPQEPSSRPQLYLT